MKINYSYCLLIFSALMSSCAKQANPEIVLKGSEEMTIYLGESFTDPGATATDYKGRDISSDIMVMGSVGESSGYYTLDYTVEDKKGNFSVEQRGVSRGFKNTDLAGTYTVERSTTNGGGSQTYTGTITAISGNITEIVIDNSNSSVGSVIMNATISATGIQISIADQTSGSCSVSYGEYGGYASNEDGNLILTLDFATNCGFTGVYNHTTTWTKQ